MADDPETAYLTLVAMATENLSDQEMLQLAMTMNLGKDIRQHPAFSKTSLSVGSNERALCLALNELVAYRHQASKK